MRRLHATCRPFMLTTTLDSNDFVYWHCTGITQTFCQAGWLAARTAPMRKPYEWSMKLTSSLHACQAYQTIVAAVAHVTAGSGILNCIITSSWHGAVACTSLHHRRSRRHHRCHRQRCVGQRLKHWGLYAASQNSQLRCQWVHPFTASLRQHRRILRLKCGRWQRGEAGHTFASTQTLPISRSTLH